MITKHSRVGAKDGRHIDGLRTVTVEQVVWYKDACNSTPVIHYRSHEHQKRRSHAPIIIQNLPSQALLEQLQRLPILLHHISIPDPAHPEAQQLPHLFQITTNTFCPHTNQLSRVSAGGYNSLCSYPPHLIESQECILYQLGIRDLREQSCQDQRIFNSLTRTLALVWRGRVGRISHHYDPAFCISWSWRMIPHSPNRWFVSL